MKKPSGAARSTARPGPQAPAEQGQAGGLQLSVQEAGGSPVEVGFQLLIRWSLPRFRPDQLMQLGWAVFGDIPDLIGRDFDEVIHSLWTKEYADEIVRIFRHTLDRVRRFVELKVDPAAFWKRPTRYLKVPLTALTMLPRKVDGGHVFAQQVDHVVHGLDAVERGAAAVRCA